MTARLLLGLGNELRGDDAAGLLVARALAARRLPGIEVRELGGEPVDLLDAWEGAESVLVVDAVSSGAEPGRLHLLDALAGLLPAAFGSSSTHALGLAEAVELGRALARLPARLLVLGIEAAGYGTGAPPSAAVLAAVERAADLAAAELRPPPAPAGSAPPASSPGRPA